VALSRPQPASCASRTPPTDGRLLPGSWGAEPRGWLLVRHYRSLLTSPSLSPRAATSPRFALPNDRRESSTRSGGRGRLGCHCEASPTPLATALRTGASAQATVRTDDRRGRVATVRRPPRTTAPSVTEQPRPRRGRAAPPGVKQQRVTDGRPAFIAARASRSRIVQSRNARKVGAVIRGSLRETYPRPAASQPS
jgi:hypothetical protein